MKPHNSHMDFLFFFTPKTPLPNHTKVLGELPLQRGYEDTFVRLVFPRRPDR